MMMRAQVWIGGAAMLLAAASGALADKSKTGAKPADKPKGAAVLPGGNSGKPINIEAGKLDYFDKEQKLIYTGNVIAVQGDSTLKSSVLTIFLAPKKSGDAQPAQSSTNQVQRMIAKGPVTLLQRDQIGTGDNGVYEKAQNTVVLTGNVTLSQGPNVTKGDRLVYDLKSGLAVVTSSSSSSPVRSIFDTSSTNADAQPEAAAPAPAHRSKPKRSGG